MSQANVIGIAGPARSGKDTVRQFILACNGGYSYSFADPLYAMVHAGLGLDLRDQYWQDRKEEPIEILGKSPRQILQTLGTEWARQMINEDIWLIMAQQRMYQYGPGMVIADVRFENEAQWVRKANGRMVHLRRKAAPTVNAHASEGGVQVVEGDIVIHNDGSLEDLQAAVRGFFDVTKT